MRGKKKIGNQYKKKEKNLAKSQEFEWDGLIDILY